MTIPNTYLQAIIDGKIGVIDSTQAVAVAKELLAARKYLKLILQDDPDFREEVNALAAWRKAAE